MKKITLLILLGILVVNYSFISQNKVPVPLYTDPNFKGAADAEVIYSKENSEWMFYYTCRRSVCEGAPLPALSIGVAASKYFINWEHRGYIKVDGIGGEAIGPDVLWAPEIIRDGDVFICLRISKTLITSAIFNHSPVCPINCSGHASFICF